MPFPGNTSNYAPGVSSTAASRANDRSERRTQRNEDFKQQAIESANQFNFDQYNRKDVEGTHISGAEVNHLRSNHQHNGGTGSRRDTYRTLTKQKEAGATFGNRAQAQYDRMGKAIEKKDNNKNIDNLPDHLDQNDPDVRAAFSGQGWGSQDQARYDKIIAAKGRSQQHSNDANTLENRGMSPGGKPDQVANIKNTQTQDITQDNDINSNVNGNNNTVINEQDNSIRQYGGDNRSFVYNAGKNSNPYESTPVSAATMGGFYDVDDSPAAQAKFNDMYTTMNRDNQKRYAGDAMKTFAKYGNTDARSYTNESMENALGKSTQYSFDRADRQTGHVFGDIWNDQYITEDWKMPSAPKAIESNAADIADKAKDDIEDI